MDARADMDYVDYQDLASDRLSQYVYSWQLQS